MKAKEAAIWIVRVAAFAAVLAAGAAVSAGLTGKLLDREPPPPARDIAAWYTAEKLDEATQHLSGEVAAAIRAELSDDTTLAVVLRGRDVKGCEDLGRQLRALRRSAGERKIEVWTDEIAEESVRRFLRRERIVNVDVVAVNTGKVLAGGRTLATPAALVVLRDGALLEGIAHPTRFPNTRPRSFAEELTFLAGAQPSR